MTQYDDASNEWSNDALADYSRRNQSMAPPTATVWRDIKEEKNKSNPYHQTN